MQRTVEVRTVTTDPPPLGLDDLAGADNGADMDTDGMGEPEPDDESEPD
jgi:hypothetical protein